LVGLYGLIVGQGNSLLFVAAQWRKEGRVKLSQLDTHGSMRTEEKFNVTIRLLDDELCLTHSASIGKLTREHPMDGLRVVTVFRLLQEVMKA
jgi:hypothetical protein